MAGFGANHPCFKPEGADAGVVLGKLVSANLTVNLASGELYADDALAEQVSEFASGSIAMETDSMTDENASIVYGCTVKDGVVTYNKNDTAPNGVLGYYKVLMRNKKKYFKAYFYPSVRAALGNDNAQTRGNSINFTTESTTFTVFADDAGDWRETKTFNSVDAAKAWIEEKCGISKYYAISVVTQGSDNTSSVAYVAAGKDFVADVTGQGDVVAAYDNGKDVSGAFAGGTYTLTAVDADHSIVIIFE